MPAGRRGGVQMGLDRPIDPDVPFAMVRVWDFSVAPGRRYRYRVKLVLDDVNNPVNGVVDRRALAPEVAQRVEEVGKPRPRRTDWSEPSRVISVPNAGDVFVASIKPPSKKANSEGEATLLVQSFSLNEDRRAIKGGLEQSFRRGAVMNLVEDVEIVTPDGRFIEKYDSFEFQTGVTLCDFRGGDELGGGLDAPASVLLMDATGRLFVKDQVVDEPTVEKHRFTFDEDNADGGFGGGGFGGGRGFEGGGYGPGPGGGRGGF